MRVLVTGATGFLGRAMALRLARDGVAVRALARDGRDTRTLEVAGAEIARGDVRDFASVRDAVRGCSHVVHLAAQKTTPGASAAAQHDVNVRGTRNVVTAAGAEGVTRLVYGSSLGVHGFVTRGLLDEDSAVRPDTPYRKSKWLGEIAVREAFRRDGLPVVIARISTVVGPGANNWLPFAELVRTGSMRLMGDGSNHLDLVPVDDMIDGLWKCAVAPVSGGSCYVLGSCEEWTVRAFAETIASSLGVGAPRSGMPAAPYQLLSSVAALLFRTTGYHSAFAHGRETLVANKRSTSARARAELGYSPGGSVRTAIGDMITQFIAEGRLSPASAPKS